MTTIITEKLQAITMETIVLQHSKTINTLIITRTTTELDMKDSNGIKISMVNPSTMIILSRRVPTTLPRIINLNLQQLLIQIPTLYPPWDLELALTLITLTQRVWQTNQ